RESPMLEGRTVALLRPCLQAPDAYNHDGFYLRWSTGFGYAGFSGNGPAGHVSISDTATLGAIALGGTIATGLVLGGTIGAVTATRTSLHGDPQSRTVDAAQIHIAALLDWFPRP